MPNTSNEHIDQLKAYLAGKLDGKGRHALERQALEDPFLAEALEGLQEHPTQSVAALEQLRRQLRQRTAMDKDAVGTEPEGPKKEESHSTSEASVGRGIRNWWYGVAALFVLGLGGYFLLVWQSTDTGTENLTQELVRGIDQVPTDSLSATGGNIASEKPTDADAAATEIGKGFGTSREQPRSKVHDAQPDAAKIAKNGAGNGNGNAIGESGKNRTPLINSIQGLAINKENQRRFNESAPPGITAAPQAAVPESPIAIAKAGRSAAQKTPGNEDSRIAAMSRVLPADTQTSRGMDSGAGDSVSDRLAMSVRESQLPTPTSGAVNEVVVVGYGTQRSARMTGAVEQKKKAKLDTRELAQNPDRVLQRSALRPLMTKEAFDGYIAAQIATLRSAGDLGPKLHGTVLLKFGIPESGDGIPNHLSVAYSSDKRLSRAAKKLLSDGPYWEIIPGTQSPYIGWYLMTF